jgi:hypothetical protein
LIIGAITLLVESKEIDGKDFLTLETLNPQLLVFSFSFFGNRND